MPVKRLSLKLRRRRSRDGQPCGEGGTPGGEFLRPPNRPSHKNSNANHGTNPKEANCDQYNYEECSPAQMGKSGTSSQEHPCIPQVIKTATTTSEHPPIPSEITVHRPNDAQNFSEQQPARTMLSTEYIVKTLDRHRHRQGPLPRKYLRIQYPISSNRSVKNRQI